MAPEVRAREGVFLAFQYPVAIRGITNAYFLRSAVNAIRKHRGEEELGPVEFMDALEEKLKAIGWDSSYLTRPVNDGFSGGEKKRNEILQLAVPDPRLAILDEPDSARGSPGRMTDVDRYLAAFKAFAGNGAGRAPSWLKEIREGAIARFAELGFPTTKQEEWRFTSVAAIAETRFSHPPSRIPHPVQSQIESLFMGTGPRVVLVDGRYAPELSSAAGRPAGVRVESLASAVAHGPGSELAREHLARHARWHDSPFAALNTAFLADGAFVHVPAGANVEQPLE